MKKNGFTLIEILLYLFSISALILIFVNLYVFSVNAKIKGEILFEVNQEGALILTTMKQDIKMAQQVSLVSDNEIYLTFYSGETVNYVFEDNKIILQRNGFLENLTSNYVLVKNGKFQINSLDFVEIDFDLTYLNKEEIKNYDIKEHFYGGVSIRK